MEELRKHSQSSIVARLALPLAIVALIPSLVGLKLLGDLGAQNRAAIRYICSSTGVLDGLVQAGKKQINLNVSNGTYDRLVARGVLTADNVRAAKALRDQYQAAHVKLSDPAPCRSVGARFPKKPAGNG